MITTNMESALALTNVDPAELDVAIQLASRKLTTIVPVGRLVVKNDQIVIRSRNESEFHISILFEKPYFIVNFDDWHEQFHDLESAIFIVSQAVLGVVRLRVDRIGGRPWRWTVEGKNSDGHWSGIYVNSIFMFEWGRTKDTAYRVIGCVNCDTTAYQPVL